MKAITTVITPAQAARWLESANIDNRRLRPTVVTRYASDMKAGRWHLTGETVKFNGRALLDGQHRLAACVEADTPFETLVVHDVEQSSRVAMDSGARRSAGDILSWMGEVNVNNLAAALNLLLNVQHGTINAGSGQGFSNDVLVGALDQNPGIRDSLTLGSRLRAVISGPIGAWAVLHYLASQMDDQDAWEFFEQLHSGANLEPGDPILALRNWAANTAAMRNKPRGAVYLATGIKAWNAWRDGIRVGLVRWRPRTEQFPELH